ncbi:MAG: hypothetical protein M0Z41_20785 [Peptococcaceae bacterium]|nr:hypothetical protein [Peptococcaceae bacterium]
MGAQEEITSGLSQQASAEDEQLKGPVGWYIMQAISGLEQSLRSDREYVRNRLDSLSQDIKTGDVALGQQIGGVRQDMKAEIGGVRQEMKAGDEALARQISDLRKDTHDDLVRMDNKIEGLRKEVKENVEGLRNDIKDLQKSSTRTLITTAIAALGIIATLVALTNHLK